MSVYDISIQRFIQRLTLPLHLEFKIIKSIVNDNQELKQNFILKRQALLKTKNENIDDKNSKNIDDIDGKNSNNINNKQGDILQLYHSSRDYFYKGKEIIDSIFKNSVIPSFNPYLNKGPGAYFANHSRYASGMMGSSVFICNIIYDPLKVKAFRSEINSENANWNYEYTVTDKDLIYPCLFLEFEIIDKTTQKFNVLNAGFVEHGNFGCKVCDAPDKWNNCRRCDCQQPISSNDFIEL